MKNSKELTIKINLISHRLEIGANSIKIFIFEYEVADIVDLSLKVTDTLSEPLKN